MEQELAKKRTEAEILMNEEDNLKVHINKLEAEVKNLRISENDLKTKLYKKEEEFNKKLSQLELEKKKDTERYRDEVDTMRDQLNETSKMHTINFNHQDNVEMLSSENSRLREDLKLVETRFEVFNRELLRLKKENQEYSGLHKDLTIENNRLKQIIQERESVLDRVTLQLEKQGIELSKQEEERNRIS